MTTALLDRCRTPIVHQRHLHSSVAVIISPMYAALLDESSLLALAEAIMIARMIGHP
jgi:hypothetical protein